MTTALNTLLQRTTIDDHEEVLEACNAHLKQSKNDLQAQHVKAVALLQLSRFNDAVRLFDDGGDRLKDQAQFEYAYALYKAGQLEKADDVAAKLQSRGVKHLQAQVSYRLEGFEDASAIYQELLRGSKEEESDVRINLNAAYAQLVWGREGGSVTKMKAEREDLEAFETAYNVACLSIARGELAQANVLLKRAKDLCDASDDLTPEQRQEELLPISVQQLYVLYALGKHEEADAISQQIQDESILDGSTRQIAITNKQALAAKSGANPFLIHRLLSTNPPLPRNDQFFDFQRIVAEHNQRAADLACSKFDGVARSTKKFLNASSAASLSQRVNGASSANAAAHAQNRLGKLGLKEILPLLEKRPNDVGLVATVVQLYLLTQNQGAAIQVLEKLLKRLDESKAAAEQDVRYSPGLVAIIVSLYSLEGRKSHIRTELAKAASHCRHKSISPNLLKSAGLSLLESGSEEDLKQASGIFQDLLKSSPNDPFARAGFTASNPKSQQAQTINQLTSIESLTSGINVDALERAGIPQTAAATSNLLKRKRVSEAITKPKKTRVRKSRLPKDFDPEKKPDPERWLPLRDRSSYKPKGKKGKQKQAAATQGASDKSAEVKGAGGSQAKSQVVTGPSSGGGKAKKKGKKK